MRCSYNLLPVALVLAAFKVSPRRWRSLPEEALCSTATSELPGSRPFSIQIKFWRPLRLKTPEQGFAKF